MTRQLRAVCPTCGRDTATRHDGAVRVYVAHRHAHGQQTCPASRTVAAVTE